MKNTVNAKVKGTATRRAYLGLLGTLLFLAACNSGLEPQVPEASLATQASCLSGGKLINLGSSYGSTLVIRNQSSPRVDARGTTVRGRPTVVFNGNRNSSCLSGGTYDVGLSLSASWSTYHESHSLILFDSPNVTIENATIVNSGDAFSAKQNASGWVFRDSYVKNAGDDGVESDRFSSGAVKNVLFDSVFMGVSCRAEKKGSPKNYTVRMENSLLAMSPRRSAYLFKVNEGSSSRCKISLSNNVFYLPDDAGWVDPQDSPRVSHDSLTCSSRNTIVYTGGNKSYLAYLKKADPNCFTVTTDKSVWTKARSNWFSKNSQFSKYR